MGLVRSGVKAGSPLPYPGPLMARPLLFKVLFESCFADKDCRLRHLAAGRWGRRNKCIADQDVQDPQGTAYLCGCVYQAITKLSCYEVVQ